MSAEIDGTTIAVSAVEQTLENFDCQPVLFIGAGLARRYIGAPDWEGALRHALSCMGEEGPDYSYLVQKHNDDKVAIGTDIGNALFEWAWAKGRGNFEEELYQSKDRYIFLKTVIADHLRSITPKKIDEDDKEIVRELKALVAIRPHAIITTNYDDTLERIFTGYEPIVGTGVLRYNLDSFGEIFHIHGSVSDPSSLVISGPDYESWSEDSRYFAAKLLTYFVEHPVFIFGYGLGDPNVQTVLRDIGRITADETGLIGNVIQIVWHSDPDKAKGASEFVVAGGSTQYRLKVLNVSSLADIFEALAAQHDLKYVNPALVRALAARVMKLTRKDIPNGEVEVDFTTLERLTSSDDEVPRMLGLTITDTENKLHPYTLGMVAEELGLKNWQQVDKILKRIEEDKGVKFRDTDNRYHCKIKTGKKENSATRKWSQEAIDLIKKASDGLDYQVDL
ncbi:SIR2 family protein [Sphingomonas sp. IC4-52]|uniref:SIR2 family protein n=1 Tax=Sphingomonas sp. IC4-52 TaxID=2887202 RepID=UPI001D1193B0|nr:SIR2 family protein [Sphingomonas sp. IC4-52]MCC2980360.1 SIR2 family protein [Sphingomonas sp. IC4-52]